MNGLDPSSRALLVASDGCHEPTVADRNRIQRRLVARLGVAAGVGTLGSVAMQTGSAMAATAASGTAETSIMGTVLGSAKLITVSKIVGLALATSAAGFGGYRFLAAPSDTDVQASRPAAVRAVSPAVASQKAGLLGKANELKPAQHLDLEGTVPTHNADVVATGTARTRTMEPPSTVAVSGAEQRQTGWAQPVAIVSPLPPTAAFPPDAPSLSAEARGLARAQAALREGQPDQALLLLEQQKAQFAGGSLEEERDAARVLALCKNGQIQASNAAAADFLRKAPYSVLAERVANACSNSK